MGRVPALGQIAALASLLLGEHLTCQQMTGQLVRAFLVRGVRLEASSDIPLPPTNWIIPQFYGKIGYRNTEGLFRTDRGRGAGLMREEVEKALESIREYLRMDGGDIELVDVSEDGVVKVRLLGACGTCPFSTMTMQMGVQKSLMEQVPGVKTVENVTAPTA